MEGRKYKTEGENRAKVMTRKEEECGKNQGEGEEVSKNKKSKLGEQVEKRQMMRKINW